ncbi:13630_t:CDS:2, partial [Cetraspora pellucida]
NRCHSSQGCLYHPYAISNGAEQVSPTTSTTPPLKNEMLYINEQNSHNSNAYANQQNVYNLYSYDNHDNNPIAEQPKPILNVSEQSQPTFDLQHYREGNYREVEMMSNESQSDVPSDPSSFYSSSVSTPYSTSSDDSFNDPICNREASLEPSSLIYAQETSSNDTQIVPISPSNYSDSSTVDDLPTPVTVKSMTYQIASPNISPGFCPYFPPSMYPYLGYPVIPSITLKESPMVPSSDRPPRPKNHNSSESDCKTQLYDLLNKVKLIIDGDIQSMAQNWSVKDFKNRRRLIQFIRRVEGDEIRVTFKPVKPDKRPKYGIFVSCIWWEAKDEYYITSVDCIYLLECLTGIRLTQDEKNRIRRNLEIFKPLTVGKNKKDSEDLFRVIMGFPAPKPRNIEKDVKVFPWSCVIYAINKILRKYMNHGT